MKKKKSLFKAKTQADEIRWYESWWVLSKQTESRKSFIIINQYADYENICCLNKNFLKISLWTFLWWIWHTGDLRNSSAEQQLKKWGQIKTG